MKAVRMGGLSVLVGTDHNTMTYSVGEDVISIQLSVVGLP